MEQLCLILDVTLQEGIWVIWVEKSLSEYPHLRGFWSRSWPLMVFFAVQAGSCTGVWLAEGIHTDQLFQKPMSAPQLRAVLGQFDCELQLGDWLCPLFAPRSQGTEKENTLKCSLGLLGLPLKYRYLLTSVPFVKLLNNLNLPVGSFEKDRVSTI